MRIVDWKRDLRDALLDGLLSMLATGAFFWPLGLLMWWTSDFRPLW